MDDQALESLRYPIGKFQKPESISVEQIRNWTDILEALPFKLEDLVGRLTEVQLDSPYRPGGWTIRQLVHHIADSHHNSYIRFKWALTEEEPLIKAYDEKKWAELHDSVSAPIALSLNHLKAVHAKLVYLLRGLDRPDLDKKFIHPDNHEATSLAENIGRYAWHSNHHFAHIKNACNREGWLSD